MPAAARHTYSGRRVPRSPKVPAAHSPATGRNPKRALTTEGDCTHYHRMRPDGTLCVPKQADQPHHRRVDFMSCLMVPAGPTDGRLRLDLSTGYVPWQQAKKRAFRSHAGFYEADLPEGPCRPRVLYSTNQGMFFPVVHVSTQYDSKSAGSRAESSTR